ncbi:MAG: hypothetical protein IPL49_14160 [Saprospirales bacterium]|nr:hypothetical protein [Saprospirales bacterium]
MKVHFKNRIALFNTVAAAVASLLVFTLVYFVVFQTSYNHLDADIRQEADEVFRSIAWQEDSIHIDQLPEWEEQEHRQIEVNPTFLQVVEVGGRRLFHSANMLEDHLLFDTTVHHPTFFNSRINDQLVRVGQYPIRNKKKQTIGYLSIGVSRKESTSVLQNLRATLLISFPFLLVVLYLATSVAASQSIAPVNQLIRVASGINDTTIHHRLPLPAHKDEIYSLAATINELLSRIEGGMTREKQFTSDASHELRTPLAAIRGTLEVLIRKPRETEFYEEKVQKVIREVDRMDQLLDQLLQLARLEAGHILVEKEETSLYSFLTQLREPWIPALEEKQMQLNIHVSGDISVYTDPGLLDLILGNLVGNAIKYGNIGGTIHCTWDPDHSCLAVTDDGPGIPAEHIPKLFDRFYRTDESRNSRVKGTGLGLSIVKKLSDLIDIRIEVGSQPDQGATFCLFFPH